jgi:hypothetical protein
VLLVQHLPPPILSYNVVEISNSFAIADDPDLLGHSRPSQMVKFLHKLQHLDRSLRTSQLSLEIAAHQNNWWTTSSPAWQENEYYEYHHVLNDRLEAELTYPKMGKVR